MNFKDYNNNFNDENNDDLAAKVKVMTNALRARKKHNSDYIYPSLDEVEIFTNFCIEKENFFDAEMYANIWLEYIPQSPEIFHKLAFIKLQLEKNEEALLFINKAIDLSPFDSDILLTKVKILENEEKFLDCFDLVETILTFDPTNEEVIFYKGISLSNLMLYNEAISVFEGLLSNEELKFDVYAELAIIYTEMDNLKQAESYYLKCIEIDPFDSKIWYNKGLMHSDFEQIYKAIDSLTYSILLDKRNYSAYKLLANLYANLGRFSTSAQVYEDAIELFKNKTELYIHLGGIYGDIGQFDKAISIFTKAIDMKPSSFQAYLGRGICYDMIDDYESAVKDFDSAIAIDPSNRELWYSRADTLYNMGKYKRALTSYKKVIELDPSNEEAHYDYASLMLELEDYENAKDSFTDMITLFPHNAMGYYGLSKIYFISAYLDLALEHLIKAVEIDYQLIHDFKKTYHVLLKDYPELMNYIESKISK